jgi:hypothetical protein
MKSEDSQIFGITFLCTPIKPHPVVLSHEHIDFAWIRENEVGNYPFSRGVAEDIKKWDWDLIRTIITRAYATSWRMGINRGMG